MKLTAGERRVLEGMTDGHARPGELLSQAVPGGWWLGDDQVPGRIGWALLRKVLIRVVYDDQRGTFYDYAINEDGIALLANANYETPIERHFTEARTTDGR